MKVPGLEYEFETELAQVTFRTAIRPGRSGMVMPSAAADDKTQLLLDAESEVVAVLRWGGRAEREGVKGTDGKYTAPPKSPSVALVPFGNIASMVPVLQPAAAAAKK